MAELKVLGLDPGLRVTGWGVILVALERLCTAIYTGGS